MVMATYAVHVIGRVVARKVSREDVGKQKEKGDGSALYKPIRIRVVSRGSVPSINYLWCFAVPQRAR